MVGEEKITIACVMCPCTDRVIQAEAIDPNDGRTIKRRKANAIDALCCIFPISFFFARHMCVYGRNYS